jgi:hypothetical protein
MQVTFDCANPATLAAFWSEVLSYPPPAILDEDHAIIGDPKDVHPPLFFQRVPEAKVAKNRVHLDVHVGSGSGNRRPQIDSEADRLVGLGARRLHSVPGDGGYFVVMQDPEGNEFCLD